jgi:hypothetical protein
MAVTVGGRWRHPRNVKIIVRNHEEERRLGLSRHSENRNVKSVLTVIGYQCVGGATAFWRWED